ncbi:MAG: lipocalin-like domain-containing protein, partial [Acidobacteriota bacterium]
MDSACLFPDALKSVALTLAAAIAVLLVLASTANPEDSGYPAITGPCRMSFPADHGPHPDYRTEWWYYTGNLTAGNGAAYGFQLTFFRSRIVPPEAEKSWPEPHSAWRTAQLFAAHAALTDISRTRFHHAERTGRGAVGIAGAEFKNETATVFLRDWSVVINSSEHTLAARTDDFALDLRLAPAKPPVPHGDGGYSLKGGTPERASCYYSVTRFETTGSLMVDGKPVPVSGTAWMDHEFSSAPLEPGLAGWDWFSLQLEDRTEFMVYFLRRKDGSFSPASSGTYVDASGRATHLNRGEISMEVLDWWESPRSKARYPSRWRLRVDSLGLD